MNTVLQILDAVVNNHSNEAAPDFCGRMTKEQLGLKLESAKGPVQVLVIDHVERPSEN